MSSRRERYEGFRPKPAHGETLYKKTLMLACGLVLISLCVYLSGCASSSPEPTKTVTRYVGPSLDMVRDMPRPQWQGRDNGDVLDLIEEFSLMIEEHNIGQEAVRKAIRNYDAGDR